MPFHTSHTHWFPTPPILFLSFCELQIWVVFAFILFMCWFMCCVFVYLCVLVQYVTPCRAILCVCVYDSLCILCVFICVWTCVCLIICQHKVSWCNLIVFDYKFLGFSLFTFPFWEYKSLHMTYFIRLLFAL